MYKENNMKKTHFFFPQIVSKVKGLDILFKSLLHYKDLMIFKINMTNQPSLTPYDFYKYSIEIYQYKLCYLKGNFIGIKLAYTILVGVNGINVQF